MARQASGGRRPSWTRATGGTTQTVEDMDMAVCAAMRGWKMLMVPASRCLSEVPVRALLTEQQNRWTSWPGTRCCGSALEHRVHARPGAGLGRQSCPWWGSTWCCAGPCGTWWGWPSGCSSPSGSFCPPSARPSNTSGPRQPTWLRWGPRPAASCSRHRLPQQGPRLPFPWVYPRIRARLPGLPLLLLPGGSTSTRRTCSSSMACCLPRVRSPGRPL